MSKSTSTSYTTVYGASDDDDDFSRPSTAIHPADHGDPSPSDTNYVSKSFRFSSGNPRIEETRAVMHLLHGINPTSSALPVRRKPLLCVLGVPNHMTYTEFYQYCGSLIQHILEIRILRIDGMEDQYSILIRFNDQNSADAFHQHFNGRRFSSLEVDSCCALFTMDVQYTSSAEHAQASPPSSKEQSLCPVCLERLDQHTGGILTTICNHSFHCSCLSKWTDSSCPVCQNCQQQPENSKCFVCQTSENVWSCVLCGFVGCGRYKEGHALKHWKETQHCYSLELETKRVWDYVGDNYVHSLIQSKTDFVNEYHELLTTELEKQKLYFESLLQEANDETEREISVAIKNSLRQNTKLRKMQAKLDKGVKDKKFQDDINKILLKNKDKWEGDIKKIEEREDEALRRKDEKIHELNKQLVDIKAVIGVEDDEDDEVEEIPVSFKFHPQ